MQIIHLKSLSKLLTRLTLAKWIHILIFLQILINVHVADNNNKYMYKH